MPHAARHEPRPRRCPGPADAAAAGDRPRGGFPGPLVVGQVGWENDRGFPDVTAGVRLAEALGVPVERLAEGVDDPAGDES
jgi:hypothetical protein